MCVGCHLQFLKSGIEFLCGATGLIFTDGVRSAIGVRRSIHLVNTLEADIQNMSDSEVHVNNFLG
jgi:hypothetical protein